MPERPTYSTEPGKHLVIWITGVVGNFIAEITQSYPLQMKVTETGPYAHLKAGDYIVQEDLSARYQNDDAKEWDRIFREAKARDNPYKTGLLSAGVEDDQLRELVGCSPD